jgi:uncharacterized cupin superfamily protein
MHKAIINLNEIKQHSRSRAIVATGDAADSYGAKMWMVGSAIGAQKLGYNVTSVPPGKRAFPFHNHRVNEELFLILKGTGEIRIGKESYPIKQHDLIGCPPGDEDSAHQIINTGETELAYLAVSTKFSPEIANYPDSGKFAVLADYPADKDGEPRRFSYVGREKSGLDYWDGE